MTTKPLAAIEKTNLVLALAVTALGGVVWGRAGLKKALLLIWITRADSAMSRLRRMQTSSSPEFVSESRCWSFPRTAGVAGRVRAKCSILSRDSDVSGMLH